ncbi:hypothetical protein DFH08DRAFT_960006 [Mycena albidolilacea]|uniref:Uncharacterized protein n=1 Tax=Mycena albidolilacea TaxID=1033008 RepID=A0AAD7A467_9AGAR|nr:hypothetical protein DFH08DRAFT_960006 [Mycena albidolilacea]
MSVNEEGVSETRTESRGDYLTSTLRGLLRLRPHRHPPPTPTPAALASCSGLCLPPRSCSPRCSRLPTPCTCTRAHTGTGTPAGLGRSHRSISPFSVSCRPFHGHRVRKTARTSDVMRTSTGASNTPSALKLIRWHAQAWVWVADLSMYEGWSWGGQAKGKIQL